MAKQAYPSKLILKKPDLLAADPFSSSPCVGRCSTVYGDSVCRGCKRFMHEITQWNQYNRQQKEQVWRRLECIISSVVHAWVHIQSIEKLANFLAHHGIRYNQHLPPSAWALACLESFPYELDALYQTGLKLKPTKTSYTKTSFLTALQKQLYEVSNAYHERQIQYLRKQPNTMSPSDE